MKREILIIDDDVDIAMIITDMLTDQGFGVTHARSSEEAFEILTNRSFHLIILDINLPDAIGFEVCRELRKVSEVFSCAFPSKPRRSCARFSCR